MDEGRQSTDGQPTGRFPAHGRVVFEADGMVLVTRAEGPFNAELVRALRGPVMTASAGLRAQARPWGQLAIFYRSALATPEALGAFAAYLAELRQLDMAPAFTAYVMGPEVEGGDLMVGPLRRCFEGAGLGFASFGTEAEARRWLAERLL